jgi:signal transduction histidine kinase
MVAIASGAQNNEKRWRRVQSVRLRSGPSTPNGADDRKVVQSAMDEYGKLKNDPVAKLRTLAHDLSNSIETIMQASYLLAQVRLDSDSRKWLELIDKAAQDAARVNREIREILRTQA